MIIYRCLKISFLFFFVILFTDLSAQTNTPDIKKGSVKKSDLEGPVQYEAADIDIRVNDGIMILTGSAKVSYQNIVLSAGRITINWNTRIILAESVPDTEWVVKKESGDSVMTINRLGYPEFSESGDVMTGEVMTFNFQTKKGRVVRGRTQFEDGFYSGKTLKMIKKGSLNVSDACFTTCDHDPPHFHFWSQKMRIDVNKRVIAKPIVFYIGHIPVMGLPFFYFPITKGRHSGILTPRYGMSTMEGWYLRGLGYYWAASEYWDVKGTIDYFQKSGFLFRGDFNYNVRYKFSGAVSGSWTRKDFDAYGTKERRWDLSIRHSQIISPTARLSVNGSFVSSGSLYQQLSENREQRMRQEIRSNATYTKQFSGSRSLTININQTRNLKTDEVTETLPRINFRMGQIPLFKTGDKKERHWYNSIYFSYNTEMLYQRRKTWDSADSLFNTDDNGAWQHRANISAPQKLFGWLTFSPGMNVTETWYDSEKVWYLDQETGEITYTEKKGFFPRHIYNVSTSFSTKIYGIFKPRFAPDVMIRHVVSPNVSFGYQPDFSDDQFGYYDAVEDTSGEVQYYDRFYGFSFGGTPKGGSKSLNFSVSNLFQMKTGTGDKERKFNLFTWNLSSYYNWKSVEKKLGRINSSFRASPFKSLDISVNSSYSPYAANEEGEETSELLMDRIKINDVKSIFINNYFRMVNFSANLNLRLKGKGTSNSGSKKNQTSEEQGDVSLEGLKNVPGDRFRMAEGSGFTMPWTFNLTLSYTKNSYNPFNPVTQFWARTNIDFNLTKHWKISYRAHFDLEKKEVVSQDFSFRRDLHCWEAYIAWTPTGYNKRFYFRINVRSPMLKDLKFEKGTSTRGFSSIGNYF